MSKIFFQIIKAADEAASVSSKMSLSSFFQFFKNFDHKYSNPHHFLSLKGDNL